MPKFIGEVGVKRLWNKISEQFVQKEVGKGLSENNFSDEYKTELDNLISGTTENEVIERLKYYGDPDIILSDASYFTVNSTGETITGLTDTGKTQTELVIPYEINGKKITTLCSGSDGISGPPVSILDGNRTITKVVIPKSVTTLGGAAFYGLSSLASINIPNGVTSIGYHAFDSCTSLTSINLPNSVTSILMLAFNNCTSLASITIPNSVTIIELGAFASCSSNFTIYCEQGSYAETFAKDNNISIVYTDIKDDVIHKLSEKVDKVEGKSLVDATDIRTAVQSDNLTFTGKQKLKLRAEASDETWVTTIDANGVTIATPTQSVVLTDSLITVSDNIGESITINPQDVVKKDAQGTKMYALSDKVDKVEGKSLINSNVANAITYKDIIQPDSNNKNSFPEGVNCSDLTIGGTVGVDGSGVATEKYMIFEPATSVDPASIQFATINRNLANTSVHPTVTRSDVKFNSDGNLNLGTKGLLRMGDDIGLDYPKVTINATEGLVFDGSRSTTYSPGIKITSINGEIELTNESGTHKLSEKANASDLAKKVGTGDNYNPNTSEANVINLSGLTKEQYDSGEYTEGSSVVDRISGIEFDTGTTTKKAQITIGSDSGACTALRCSYDSIVGTQYGHDMFGISSNDIWCGDTTYSTMPGEVHHLKKKWEGKTYTISVPITDWVEKTDSENQKYYYKNITVSNMTEYGQAMTDVVMSDNVATARKQMEAYQCINRVVTGEGYVELYCFDEAPTTAFTLRVLVIGAWLG